MVQGIHNSAHRIASDSSGFGLSQTITAQSPGQFQELYSHQHGPNQHPQHQSLWQKAKDSTLSLALGALLGGGFGLWFFNKHCANAPQFFAGGLKATLLKSAGAGAILAFIGAKDWLINTLKLPYNIVHGLRHKHEPNPGQVGNPYLKPEMMDMMNDSLDVYSSGGSNPFLAQSGFLSADLFDGPRGQTTFSNLGPKPSKKH